MATVSAKPSNKPDSQNDGTSNLSIKSTFLRRLLTRIALCTTAKFYTPDGLCVPVSPHKIVKVGRRVHLVEAATMRFVAENTSIPVPKIHCAFERKKRTYIVMERISGQDLPSAWKNLSKSQTERVFDQLRKMMDELRSLKPPAGMVGVQSSVGGSLYDVRLPHGNPRFGPFVTQQDFHRWLRKDFTMDDIENRERLDEQDYVDLEDMIVKQEEKWPPPVFTHSDLNPFNILLRGDQVVGIVDWESAGWYPQYWEYTSNWFGNRTKLEWQGTLCKFLDAYPEQLKMEQVRNKWWGEW
jgi:aminoglycoside phosphotransferase